jgi:indolepyruvate decarboxylase
MKTRMQIGDYLVAYLRKLGVTHLFGIPGDLVIQLFMKFGKPRGMQVMTFSHEPGAGFAVDGYARATGKIGVLCVTYGAGGHNVVNSVAGSFSERVPILVISGGPGEEKRKLGVLIHHQAKEIESQFHIFQEITCAAKIINDPRTAATDIDEVVHKIWLHQQPGYIEIHQDMVDREIEVPREILDWDGKLAYAHSDPRKVEEAARETTARFTRARKPAVIVGIETFRYKLQREIVDLVEKMGAPCMTTVLAKGAFPMDHPQHMGVNIGTISPPPIRERVDEADLVLNLGTLLTDMNLGSRLPTLPREKSIWAVQNKVDISYHTYTDVTLRDYVKTLLKAPLKQHHEKVEYCDNLVLQPPGDARQIQVSDMLWEVNKFLQGRKGYMVVAESGDMLFAGLEIKVGHSGGYLAQGYYASMGFGVPGALGAQIGTGQRPLVLCGDGAFQMTGPEISHAPRYRLNPIVILMNNGGWGIFRPVTERQDLLTLPSWPYAELAEAWGGKGFRVQTVGELRVALAKAAEIPSFVIIEVMVEPNDLSPVTIKYIKASVGQ